MEQYLYFAELLATAKGAESATAETEIVKKWQGLHMSIPVVNILSVFMVEVWLP